MIEEIAEGRHERRTARAGAVAGLQ
jgi:hypothetical protein